MIPEEGRAMIPEEGRAMIPEEGRTVQLAPIPEENTCVQLAFDLVVCMLELRHDPSMPFRVQPQFLQVQYILEDLYKERSFLQMVKEDNYQSAAYFRTSKGTSNITAESDNILQTSASILKSSPPPILDRLEVQYLLSFLYSKRRLHKKARAILRKLINVPSAYAHFFMYGYAGCLLWLSQYHDALRHIVLAITVERGKQHRCDEGLLPRMHILKGWIHHRLNDIQRAKLQFEISKSSDINRTPNEQAHRNYIQFMSQIVQTANFNHLYDQYIALFPDDRSLWLNALLSYKISQQLQIFYQKLEAIESIAKKHGFYSNINLHTYYRKAIIFYCIQEYQKAYEYIQISQPVLGLNPYIYFVYGNVCYELDRNWESIKWLQISLSKCQAKYFFQYRALMGLNYIKLGEFSEAAKIIRENLKICWHRQQQSMNICEIQLFGKINLRQNAIQAAYCILSLQPYLSLVKFTHQKILLIISNENLGYFAEMIRNYKDIYDRLSKEEQLIFYDFEFPKVMKQMKVMVEYGFKYDQFAKGKWFLHQLNIWSTYDRMHKLFPNYKATELKELEQSKTFDYQLIYFHP